jgi:drug/metabolite transporter (DMT)-like permease
MNTARTAANRRGIVAMSVCMASFVANDAMVKYVSQSLPAAQLIFIRGVFATVVLLGVAHAMGVLRTPPGSERAAWHNMLHRPVLLRSLLDALGTMSYLAALFHMPLGNAAAINMATPLFMTLIAVLVLHERVSAGRWMATVIGFGGVLLVVQPAADGFSAWTLLCLLGALINSSRDLLTRSIHSRVPSVLITVAAAFTTATLSGAACATQGWQPVTFQQLCMLVGASLFLSAGYYLAVLCMRDGDVSVIAPFRYTALLSALLLGWAVWGDVPNTLAWIGIALLVGSGLYMVRGTRLR